jgi:hypothetical protein
MEQKRAGDFPWWQTRQIKTVCKWARANKQNEPLFYFHFNNLIKRQFVIGSRVQSNFRTEKMLHPARGERVRASSSSNKRPAVCGRLGGAKNNFAPRHRVRSHRLDAFCQRERERERERVTPRAEVNRGQRFATQQRAALIFAAVQLVNIDPADQPRECCCTWFDLIHLRWRVTQWTLEKICNDKHHSPCEKEVPCRGMYLRVCAAKGNEAFAWYQTIVATHWVKFGVIAKCGFQWLPSICFPPPEWCSIFD